MKPLIANATDRNRLDKSTGMIATMAKVNAEVRTLVTGGTFHDAQAISRSKNRASVDENAKVLDELIASQNERLEANGAEAATATAWARGIVLALLALSVVIAGLVVWVMRTATGELQATAGALREGAQQVAAAAGQMATSSRTMSQGATRTGGILEESSASERTSSATTAKPMPASPARAASTAALSARMFVWNARPSRRWRR